MNDYYFLLEQCKDISIQALLISRLIIFLLISLLSIATSLCNSLASSVHATSKLTDKLADKLAEDITFTSLPFLLTILSISYPLSIFLRESLPLLSLSISSISHRYFLSREKTPPRGRKWSEKGLLVLSHNFQVFSRGSTVW